MLGTWGDQGTQIGALPAVNTVNGKLDAQDFLLHGANGAAGALGAAVGSQLAILSVPAMSITLADVARLTVSVTKVRPFIITTDWRPTLLTDRADLRSLVAPRAEQLNLFAA